VLLPSREAATDRFLSLLASAPPLDSPFRSGANERSLAAANLLLAAASTVFLDPPAICCSSILFSRRATSERASLFRLASRASGGDETDFSPAVQRWFCGYMPWVDDVDVVLPMAMKWRSGSGPTSPSPDVTEIWWLAVAGLVPRAGIEPATP
jgi:hypothetical protein